MCLQFILFYLLVPFEVTAAWVRRECTLQSLCACVCAYTGGERVCAQIFVWSESAAIQSLSVVPMLHDLQNPCLHASLFGPTCLD